MYLKPFSSNGNNGMCGGSSSGSTSILSRLCTTTSVLSRPMQRKLVTLINCQLVEDEGRTRAMRAARSLGERTVTELILQHQNPQQLSANLWAAVRARGCQFLGPGKKLSKVISFLYWQTFTYYSDARRGIKISFART